jgi:tRNA dimethylallyltransferase
MILLYGPTAVGKSDVALVLARRLGGEIINMDVGQLYAPLTIGTAKPNWRHSNIPHHLFDILTTPTNYTVVAYRQEVMRLVREIRARARIPILVGGSGFYLKSLFFAPSTLHTVEIGQNIMPSDNAVNLWSTLSAIDPLRATAISPYDTYRVQQALNIWYTAGIKPSNCKPIFHNPFGHCALVILQRERHNLYERINTRVCHMLDAGWVDEVQALNTDWITFIHKKKVIGYTEIASFTEIPCATEYEYSVLVECIAQRTRRYARRQVTFGNMLEREFRAIATNGATAPVTLWTLLMAATAQAEEACDEIVQQLLHANYL